MHEEIKNLHCTSRKKLKCYNLIERNSFFLKYWFTFICYSLSFFFHFSLIFPSFSHFDYTFTFFYNTFSFRIVLSAFIRFLLYFARNPYVAVLPFAFSYKMSKGGSHQRICWLFEMASGNDIICIWYLLLHLNVSSFISSVCASGHSWVLAF